MEILYSVNHEWNYDWFLGWTTVEAILMQLVFHSLISAVIYTIQLTAIGVQL